jgi:hypothetical protein
MPKKQSSASLSTLAAGILNGTIEPTKAQIKRLAASVLSQDETRGQGRKKSSA